MKDILMRMRSLFAFGLMAISASVFASPAIAAAKKKSDAPVIVTTVKRQDVPRITHTVGTVLASATVQIKSLVEGRVLEAPFEEGQIVNKGDILFKIDPLPFEADLAQAKAILARDQAQLGKAQREYTRQENLRKRGVASVQTLETAKADALAMAATVASDKAQVDLAELKLGYTEIKSPLSGKTGAILVHPGNIVKANADSPMVTVSDIAKVRVAVNLPQKLLPTLHAIQRSGGTDMIVSIPGDLNGPISGRMDFISNAVNQKSGTIEVRATLNNPDYRLLPGQFVTAKLVLETYKDALIIPFEAISSSQDGPFVYVVKDDNSLDLRQVNVLYTDNGTSVIENGKLEEGEKVVIDGQLRLAEGMTVKIVKGDK